MPPPFADAHVTREDLERLVRTPLGRAAELTKGTIEEAGLRPQQLTAIFLVGGDPTFPVFLYGQLRFAQRLPMLIAMAVLLMIGTVLLTMVALRLRGRSE